MRASGILLPVSSLPSKYGIGTFGQAAREWVDFLSRAKQRYWQVLPLGPTSFGDSPYQSYSAFAGSLLYIDLELLCRQGLLKKGRCKRTDWGSDPSAVDYDRVRAGREKLLDLRSGRGGAALLRELQPYTVAIGHSQCRRLGDGIYPALDGAVLILREEYYDSAHKGLTFEPAASPLLLV